MKEPTATITIATHLGERPSEAFVYGSWAANYCRGERAWSITYVPNGLRIPPEYTCHLTRSEAQLVAMRIDAARLDMESGEPDKPPWSSVNAIKDIIRNVGK